MFFELSTEENWPSTMSVGVSAVGVDMAPQSNFNQWAGMYFILAVFVGSLFVKVCQSFLRYSSPSLSLRADSRRCRRGEVLARSR